MRGAPGDDDERPESSPSARDLVGLGPGGLEAAGMREGQQGLGGARGAHDLAGLLGAGEVGGDRRLEAADVLLRRG